MAFVIHSGKGDKTYIKTLIAGEYAGVKVELAPGGGGVTKATPQFLKMNPTGKVNPVLETPDGPIFKSNAMARYVAHRGLGANNFLLGSSLIEQAHVDQWIDFAALEIDFCLLGWFGTRKKPQLYMPDSEEAAISNVKEALGTLNLHLASNKYLVGHCVTLADIIMICDLLLGFTKLMTKSFTSEFPHLERYFWTLVNQPKFKNVLGEVTQTETCRTNRQIFATNCLLEQAKSSYRRITHVDWLHPGKMMLDEWKRLYSLNKTNSIEVAIKELWDMYDPQGYSLWFCDYKSNDENSVLLLTSLSVNLFLENMDAARKYAFGKMLIVGSEPPYKVKGLWFFCGLGIPEFLLDKDDCMHMDHDVHAYYWRKVDISEQAQKQRVNRMIMIQDVQHQIFEGEAILDAKCFM